MFDDKGNFKVWLINKLLYDVYYSFIMINDILLLNFEKMSSALPLNATVGLVLERSVINVTL